MYYSARTPNDVVVFHDMTPEGYLLADRVKGLDEKHCAMVLEKLAKLHAASIELARAVSMHDYFLKIPLLAYSFYFFNKTISTNKNLKVSRL